MLATLVMCETAGMTRRSGDHEELTDDLIADLVDVVGRSHVITDVDVTRSYSTDWTGRYVGRASAVVRPGCTDEVARVMGLCSREGIRVVPQGGNTGLVGGGVPLGGEMVLNLTRLGRLDSVDVVDAQVTVGAGVPVAVLQRHVGEVGFLYPIDLGSRESATVGGTLATNAGGKYVIRWGDTRRQVVGIEAVLADGTVIEHLGGLIKDNTGYDLAGLLCGSEGTLGVITAARLRLVPKADHKVVALIAFDDVAGAVGASIHLRRRIPDLDALELILGEGLDLVCASEGLAAPFVNRWPVYVLVEISGNHDMTEALALAVAELDSVRDAAVADDERGCAALWCFRELLTVAINRIGPPHKLDVTIPTQHLAAFPALVTECVNEIAPDAHVWLFGHIGDGNIHVNVTGVDPGDTRIDGAVFELVASLQGSISAEHGIGTAKKPWLHLSRSTQEIETFRRIKSALDPGMILNPNTLLP